MRILDVLREQEEPKDVDYKTQLAELYDKVKDLYLYTPDITDEFGNRTYGYLNRSFENGVIEIKLRITCTMNSNTLPDHVDNDIAVNCMVQLIDLLRDKCDLESYPQFVQSRIIISIDDIGLIISTKRIDDTAVMVYNIPNLIDPIKTKFLDGLQYADLNTTDKIIARYRIPESYTIKFGENYSKNYAIAYKRYKTLLNILEKGGTIDGHEYKFIKSPSVTISSFRNYKERSEFNKRDSNKVLEPTFTATFNMYPSMITIGGVDGDQVQNNNPELYRKVRLSIAKFCNNHRIVDSYYVAA